MSKVKAWSYSRLSTYKTCPAKFKYQNIDKLPGDTWANTRGIKIHKLAESFLLGNITGMPDDLRSFEQELKQLKRLKAHPEIDLTVTKDWQPTHTKDWTHAWCRSKADAVVVEEDEGSYVDFKTGKIYDSHEMQGMITATCMFAHYPDVDLVEVEMWYLDLNDTQTWVYERQDFEGLKKHWAKETKKMLTDTKFKPTPSDEACRWCPYSSKKGGPCPN